MDTPELVTKRLSHALTQAQHALRLATDDALRPLNMTTSQYAALSAIDVEPGRSTARLARAASVTSQTMQGILANLERDGLLVRHPDPYHGRRLRIHLTIEGQRTLAHAHGAVSAVESAMVGLFGDDAAERLATALAKCAAGLRAMTLPATKE